MRRLIVGTVATVSVALVSPAGAATIPVGSLWGFQSVNSLASR